MIELETKRKIPKTKGHGIIYDFSKVGKNQCMVFKEPTKEKIDAKRNSVNSAAYERNYKVVTRVTQNEESKEFELRVWVKGFRKKEK